MSDEKLRGAAFREAGHVIVAGEFGLPVGKIAIGIDGDEAKGRTDIGSAHNLPLVDQIALCVAGVVDIRNRNSDEQPSNPSGKSLGIVYLVADIVSRDEIERL